MTYITPKGTPCWDRNTSYQDFDGHLEKQNRTGYGAANIKEDVSAEGFSQSTHVLEAVAWTAPFAIMRLTLDDGYDAPTILTHLGMYGPGLVLSPTVSGGDGYAKIQWEASYADSYGRSASTNITACQVSQEGTSVSNPPSYVLEDARTVLVYADPESTVTLTLWSGGA